ncbi:hypothetical protein NW766_003940 [Fusarium irregulare]|uniref:NB-ARC domain-containing protein n=1 Tax=Fusarium irregulare TaxID=2494466 RepID=A0A9W8UAU8_9HYPO|nr:hypothetical protein NW766_003940 [Fusarium irregulare]
MQSQLMSPDGKPIKGTSILLYGLGGMGKSSIAVKHIYDNYTTYAPYIFWIPCDTSQKLNAAVLKACQQLKKPLQSSDADLEKAPRVWRQWLEQTGKAPDIDFLVVLDNVEEEALLRTVWPRVTSGTIIVTSRRRDVASKLVKYQHEVAAMSAAGSHTLLYNLLSPPLQQIGDENPSLIEKICEFLDGLPLAIALTASMICACQSISKILATLDGTRKTLLQWQDKDNTTTPLSLMVLWEANIKNLSEHSLQLLHIMGLLDADNFSDEMASPEVVATIPLSLPSNEYQYLQALEGLSEYSLVRRDRSSLCMHRLLQDVIIEKMSPDVLKETFEAAVQMVLAVFPKQSDEGLLMSSFWLQCQKYRSHVESLELRYRQQHDRLGINPAHLPELTYRCSW